MNVSLLPRAQWPIKALLCIGCLLPAGCATHKSDTRTPAPSTQPAVVSPPPPTTVSTGQLRPQRIEQPVRPSQPIPKLAPAKPVPLPAVPATVKPVATSAVQPASTATEPSKSAPRRNTDAITVTPPAKPDNPGTETITVALSEMPMSIHDQWTLDRDESRCTLQSATQHMDDGQGGTRISLSLTPSTLIFSSESDIDLSYTGTGITIGERHFDLETIERRTNPVFSKQRSALLDAMKSGHTLQLTLGFWPTWPVTHTYSVSFPLQHFATAYAAWQSCNTLLSQR